MEFFCTVIVEDSYKQLVERYKQSQASMKTGGQGSSKSMLPKPKSTPYFAVNISKFIYYAVCARNDLCLQYKYMTTSHIFSK